MNSAEERLRNYIIYCDDYSGMLDDIQEILNQNKQLKDNWKLLEEYLKEMIKHTENSAHLKEEYEQNYSQNQRECWWINQDRKEILSKMQEIGGSNEKDSSI